MRRRRRQSFTAAVAAVVFAVSGLTLVGVAIATQRRAPMSPPLTVAVAAPASDASAAASPAPAPTLAPERRDALAPERVAALAPARVAALDPARNRDEQKSASPKAVAPAAPKDPRAAAQPMSSAKPVTIDIPAIGVRSVVRHLGQAANGSLEVPSGSQYNDAAWYRYSPTPGALGPAVMMGHVDSAAQGPSVFFRLGELRPGQRVSVTRADGSVAVFAVDAVHRYAKKRFPTEVVYSDIGHAGLRILTCGGAFDDAAGSYLDNIVVFASLVGSKG